MTRRHHRARTVGLVLAVLVGLVAPATAGAAPLPYEALLRIDAATPRGAAIEVSRALHPGGNAGAVVLAREDTFPDALGAAALTTDVDGPLLLTPPDGLAAETRDEIVRLLPDGGTVYLLGGSTALGRDVERELDELGFRTPRFPGTDRIQTAAMIARFVGAGTGGEVLLVRAAGTPDLEQGWVDSVSCGGYAAHAGTPVLLTDTASPTVSDETRETLASIGARRVHVCGGPMAVPDSQLAQLREAGYEVVRHAGIDRAATAVAVAEGLWNVPQRDGRIFVLVPGYGTTFGFGLVATPLSAALDAPILLVDTANPTGCDDPLAGPTLCFLAEGSAGAEALVVVGGNGIITDDVVVAAAEAADLPKDDEPPSVPAGLTVTDRPEDDGTVLEADWVASTGETHQVTYTLYVRRSDASGALTRSNSTAIQTTDTSRTLTGLTAGVRYDVAVDARDVFGNRSALSPVVSTRTVDDVPADPPDGGMEVRARDGGGLVFSWPAAPEADMAAYDVQRRSAEPPLGDVDPTRERNCEVESFEPDWATVGRVPHPSTARAQFVDADVDESDAWCYRYRKVDTSGKVTAWSTHALWVPS